MGRKPGLQAQVLCSLCSLAISDGDDLGILSVHQLLMHPAFLVVGYEAGS